MEIILGDGPWHEFPLHADDGGGHGGDGLVFLSGTALPGTPGCALDAPFRLANTPSFQLLPPEKMGPLVPLRTHKDTYP